MVRSLLFFFSFLFISLIWFFSYIPLNDYANHLGAIHVINEVLHGSELESCFSYDFSKPASLVYLIILSFAQIVGIEFAGKLFLTLIILLNVFSYYYFFKSFRKDKKQAEILTLISFLILFSVIFYSGFLGFMISIPIFFLSLGIWNDRGDLKILAISLIILFFSHPFSALILLLCVIFLDNKLIKNPIFYLSILPFILISIYSLISSQGAGLGQNLEYLLDYNLTKLIFDLFRKFSSFFFFSNIGSVFLVLLFINLKSKIDKKYATLVSVLFIFFLILPFQIPSWQVIDVRMISYLFPFLILNINLNNFDKFSKILVILFVALTLIYNLYLFSEISKKAETFLSANHLVDANSSVAHIPTPSQFQIETILLQPYSFIHNYYVIGKEDSYSSGLFSSWFNPLDDSCNVNNIRKIRRQAFSEFGENNLEMIFSFNNCEQYERTYSNIPEELEYDYLLFLDNTCNTIDYFSNNYDLIYSNGVYLMKKSNP